MAFAIEPSPEIWYRDDFTILCNWRKLWRVVEIGVDQAEFASMFLSRWQGHFWRGVDDDEPYPEMHYDRQSDYLMAVAKLGRFSDRAKLIRTDSYSASLLFAPGSLDFVYIDASHDYSNVRDDIHAWWPALQRDGILAGHDWTDQEVHVGVKQAVTEFAREIDQTVYLTAVEGYGQEACPSWYLYRSGMPGPEWRRC